jgi:hypothetical protein
MYHTTYIDYSSLLKFDADGAVTDGVTVQSKVATNNVVVPADTGVTDPNLEITGEILDNQNNPVPDATVELKSENEIVVSTTTGKDGKYAISSSKLQTDKKYDVVAQKGSGYKSSSTLEITPGQKTVAKNVGGNQNAATEKTNFITKIWNFIKNLFERKS